jgi:hypothetical protein
MNKGYGFCCLVVVSICAKTNTMKLEARMNGERRKNETKTVKPFFKFQIFSSR